MKTATIYYLKNARKSIVIYYGIIIFTNIFMSLVVSSGGYSSSDISSVSIIFLFVVGLNSFKEYFFHFLSMCHTRKSLFMGFVTSALIISCGMAVVDFAIAAIGNMILPYNVSLTVAFRGIVNSRNLPVTDIFRLVGAYLMSISLGFIITVAYYRMNKTLKWLVSIGVPVLLFVALPYVEVVYFNGAITTAITNLVSHTILSINTLVSVASCMAVAAALLGGSFLGVRNAVVKQ